MPTSAFELDRFTAGDERLEVSGRWIGVRGRRFVRPSLTVFVDGQSTRALAELEHKPWAAEDGDEWVAAFPWPGRLDEIEEFELAVAPDLSVVLPPPDGAIRELVLPVVSPRDQAKPAQVERAPEPPRGEARELREQADAVRHNALAVRDRALADLDEATADRDRALVDLDEAIAVRDRLRAELERAAADRGRLSAELDHLAGEHDRLRARLDDLVGERDRFKSERHALEEELGRVSAEPILPIVSLPPPRPQLHRPQTWIVRALVIALIIAAVIALVIVLTSGPSSVAP